MEQCPLFSDRESIVILRLHLEEAYEQDCIPVMQELSRQMDDIQLRHWAAVLAPAS